jgi:predicted nucleic acid-binding protein
VPNILVDTGFWFALFERTDSYHAQAEEKSAYLWPLNIVIAWPVLYETLNTRFVHTRNHLALRQFQTVLKRPGAVLLDDAPYRQNALELAFASSLKRSRALSLTDCVLRLMLDDTDTRIDFLATFNIRDFADVCRKRGVRLL